MRVFAAVQCGAEKECEDSVLAGDTLICDSAERSVSACGSVCVADGVGGNAGGRFASAFVTERIKAMPPVGPDELRQVLGDINNSLIKEGSAKGFPAAATTLTGIVSAGDKEYLVHIGNTRAYLARGKYLKLLTSDHTVYNNLLKTGRIDDAAESGKNEITNCFGGGREALFDGINISEMQTFGTLLLTSDGAHDYVEIDELERLLVADALGVRTCKNIIEIARAAGSKDDISVVIVQR
jgi:protein phosphatase